MLGAWADITGTKNILDIGTGTGVIGLMLAQRSQANIIGLDPNFEAYSLAKENFKRSPFSNRMQAIHTSVQDFHSDIKFDLIVCNPPYFQNSLKPPNSYRQQQRHTDSLSQTQLIDCSSKLLSTQGKLAIVLPTLEGNLLIDHARSKKLYLVRSCAVFSKAGKPQERWLLEFGFQSEPQQEQAQIHIMDSHGRWTSEYQSLTKDFYLNF